jgi:hypothetical protein
LIGRAGELRIVIATGPQVVGGQVSLAEDVRLVRSALLYADTVELISPGALMVGVLATASQAGPSFLVQAMAGLDDDTLRHLGVEDPDQLRTGVNQLETLQSLSRAQRRGQLGPQGARELSDTLARILAELSQFSDDFAQTAHELFITAGAPELAEAADAGLLTLSQTAFDLSASSDDMIAQYTNTLGGLLTDPSAHLMFDARMAGIASAMIDEGLAEPHPLTMDHSTRAITGTGLIARLPAFPDSQMADLLRTRAELAEPLLGYRGAVRRLATAVQSSPIDPAHAVELDDIWRDLVVPELAQLRAEMSTTRIVASAAVAMGTDAKTLISGVIGPVVAMGMATVSDLSTLAAVGVGATPVAAGAASHALKEAMAARRQTRGHDLYYLLELERRL